MNSSFTSNFYWTETQLSNDSLWLNSVLPWEDISIFPWAEWFIFDILFNSHFLNIMVLTQPVTSLSFFDFMVIKLYTTLFPSKVLLNSFYVDYMYLLDSLDISNKYFFYVGFNDYLLTMTNYNEEIVFAYSDYSLYNNLFNVETSISSTISYFFQTPDNLLIDYINYYSYFLMSTLLIWSVFSLTQNLAFSKTFLSFFTRVFYYCYSLSKENRIQFDLFIQIFFFIIFFWVYTLMAYNDDEVEFIELISSSLTIYFLFIVTYLLWKYSTHYFSFLEASFIEGKSASFIAKQFVRDISNTFALFLRFFLLLFRLNIYDGLDDFLDSYYIFLCDFDDDTYYDEMLILFDSNLFYISDNETDSGAYSEIETDLLEDFFHKYFVILGKFSLFWAFILEEAFRVSLALYITYLIIFEVHSVNISFKEDSYFQTKK